MSSWMSSCSKKGLSMMRKDRKKEEEGRETKNKDKTIIMVRALGAQHQICNKYIT